MTTPLVQRAIVWACLAQARYWMRQAAVEQSVLTPQQLQTFNSLRTGLAALTLALLPSGARDRRENDAGVR